MKVRRLDRRGKGYNRIEWLLDYYEGPKRIRKWYKSKGLAEAAMDEIKGQHKVAGQSWIELSPEQRNELLGIYAEAEREKISLRTVWEAYKTGKLDAAPMQRRTLKEAIAETMEAKRTENLRERYLGDLEAYLKRFADGRMEMFIDKIGVADIEKWFSDRGEALTTRKSNLGRLGSMFDVCFRRGYIKDNPILRVASPKLDKGAPERFTADEAKVLLKEARQRPASLGYFVLAMFAGIRPEELTTLKWSCVDLNAKTVHITGEQSKVRHHRDVPLHDTAVAWLKTITRDADELIAPPDITLRRHRRALRDKLKKWPQDVLRHTAASFLVELHTKKELVAKWLGNSERTLDRNYLTPVNADECKKFWALTPKGLK
jgi:integrase